MKCHLILFLLIVLASGCDSVDNKNTQASGLVQDAIDLALNRFYEDPNYVDVKLFRTLLTPGTKLKVGDRQIPIISRSDIPDGKEVNLVRLGMIQAYSIYPDQEEQIISVELVSWSEIGNSPLHPMHAFRKYEMKLNQNGKLIIFRESLSLE